MADVPWQGVLLPLFSGHNSNDCLMMCVAAYCHRLISQRKRHVMSDHCYTGNQMSIVVFLEMIFMSTPSTPGYCVYLTQQLPLPRAIVCTLLNNSLYPGLLCVPSQHRLNNFSADFDTNTVYICLLLEWAVFFTHSLIITQL